MVEIIVHLFSKPEVEIDMENAKPEDFKRLGKELEQRLSRVAEIIGALEKSNWKRSPGIYDLNLYKKIKIKKAKQELKNLKIKEYEVSIIEDFEDENED